MVVDSVEVVLRRRLLMLAVLRQRRRCLLLLLVMLRKARLQVRQRRQRLFGRVLLDWWGLVRILMRRWRRWKLENALRRRLLGLKFSRLGLADAVVFDRYWVSPAKVVLCAGGIVNVSAGHGIDGCNCFSAETRVHCWRRQQWSVAIDNIRFGRRGMRKGRAGARPRACGLLQQGRRDTIRRRLVPSSGRGSDHGRR